MPNFKLVESPIDLLGLAETTPVLILVFECDKLQGPLIYGS
jgi:hypothetical protein